MNFNALKQDWNMLPDIPQDIITTIFQESKRRFTEKTSFLPLEIQEEIFSQFWLRPQNNFLTSLKISYAGDKRSFHDKHHLIFFVHPHKKTHMGIPQQETYFSITPKILTNTMLRRQPDPART